MKNCKSRKQAQDTKWIRAALSNDENSTDQQLVEYFILEGGLSKSEAVYWIGQRNYYLNNIR